MPTRTQWLGAGVGRLPGGDAWLRRAAGVADRSRAPIFMLHRVLPDVRQCYDPEMAISTAGLRRFCAWLATEYEVVPLTDLPMRLGTPGRRPLCALTFDDGWLDTYTHAFPILQQFALSATVFLPLLYIGTHRRFWQERLFYQLRDLTSGANGAERLRAVALSLPWCPEMGQADQEYARLRRLLLRRSSEEAEEFVDRLGAGMPTSLELTGRAFINWDEVAAMQRAGISFGSHTLDHTLLRSSSPSRAKHILQQSRQALSDQLGCEADTLSYPWGGHGFFGAALAQEAGFALAVSTAEAFCRGASHRWRLPRFAVSETRLGAGSGSEPRQSRALLVHMVRKRLQPDRVSSAGAAGQRLRLGFLLDSPEVWSQPELYHGGSEIQIRHILEALDPAFFDVELYFLREPDAGLVTPWPWFAAAASQAGRWAVIAGLRRLLRVRRPALVQAMFQSTLTLGVIGARLARVPAIVCARRNMGYWKRWHHRLSLRLVNQLTTGWQTNGRNIAQMLQRDEGVPAARIEILPNWLDLERFRPANLEHRDLVRRQLEIPATAVVFAVVASYRDVKNHATLLNAAVAVCSRKPSCLFLLIGDGPERKHIQATITQLGLERFIRMTGSVRNVEQYLAAADVGVLSSWNEGCSNAVLEYMAAGLPVVASDIPANAGLLAPGSLVPPGDPGAWAQALVAIANDAVRRRSEGEANRQHAEVYGSGAFTERVQAHYLRMAAGGRSG